MGSWRSALVMVLLPILFGPRSGVAGADACAEFSRGLLWRVERPGSAPSHVFGTIHFADPRVTRLPPVVQEALGGSASFTMEISLDVTARRAFADAMFLEGGRRLDVLVDAATFEQAVRRMGAAGYPPEVTSQLKPWAVLINLVVPEARDGVILDSELLHQAMLQRKTVYQLETVDEQIAVFDDIPMETQLALLQDTLRRFDQMAGTIGKTIEAYLAADLGGIWRINTALMEGAGAAASHHAYFIKRVIHGRSIIMAHRMQARLREGNAFFAVGAMHLYGEHGILSLLKQEGFAVTRIY